MKIKTTALTMLYLALVSLSACSTQSAIASKPVTAPPSATPEAILSTSIGDLVYVSARFVNEVHGETPEPGYKILLVVLERANGEKIDLQAFDSARIGVHILGDDGSETISPMAGWVENEFVMGFRLPETVKTYQLVWPGNSPINIIPASINNERVFRTRPLSIDKFSITFTRIVRKNRGIPSFMA